MSVVLSLWGAATATATIVGGQFAFVGSGTAIDRTVPIVQRLDRIESDTANTPTGNSFRPSVENLSGWRETVAQVLDRMPASELLKRLESFHHLGEGWDGDDAPAPANDAIARARHLVDSIGRFPDEIDPDAVGGIAFWFYLESGAKMMLGLRNSGAAVVCSYAPGSPLPHVTCVASDAQVLQTIALKFAELA